MPAKPQRADVAHTFSKYPPNYRRSEDGLLRRICSRANPNLLPRQRRSLWLRVLRPTVLVNNLPLLRLGECPELDELTLVIFVLRTHSCVQCDSLCHG